MTTIFEKLKAHQAELSRVRIADLLASDAARAERMSLDAGPLFADFSKHLVTEATLNLLLGWARDAGVEAARTRMFAGDAINTHESRAVLHVALRGGGSGAQAEMARAEARAVLTRMARLADEIRGSGIKDVVHIGIGGSDLGPRLVVDALSAGDGPHVHFVANTDPTELAHALRGARPETTVFIVVSKTFTTAETLANARAARAWSTASGASSRFIAVTGKPEEARQFGIFEADTLPMPDWVGGRFSVWSAVGLAAMVALGAEKFGALLEGAHAIDEHFSNAPLEQNAPVLMALLGAWYVHAFGCQSHGLIPYAQRLHLMPAWLQQLEMESNGKQVGADGVTRTHATAPVVFGGVGANSQHSFHQLFHQSSLMVPLDFIVVKPSADPRDQLLAASALAQAAALMSGETDANDPHHHCPGNRPSTMIVLPTLDARTLGALLALYEHKTFVQGVLWGLNSFDQPGVELGKRIAQQLVGAFSGDTPVTDASTAQILKRLL